MGCNCGQGRRNLGATTPEVVAMDAANREAQARAEALIVANAPVPEEQAHEPFTRVGDYLKEAAYEASARATEEHFRESLEAQAS
jgi:hypothetical protein